MAFMLLQSPKNDRNRSLGWLAISWMEALVVHGRGAVTGERVVMGDEQSAFILDCYAVDEDGRRLYDSAFYSAPKGTDKSGLAARIDMFEALGPCRTLPDAQGLPVFAKGGETYEDPYGLGFSYTYEPGEPMGMHSVNPTVRCMATEEGQTGNVYDSIYYNLTQGPLAQALDFPSDAGLTRILLPRQGPNRGGKIQPSTSGSASKDGGLETHATFDESHLYNTSELRGMYNTVTRNLTKRRREGSWYLETTTMYAVGENSIAEGTYRQADAILAGKARNDRLLVHHRWGEIEAEELADEPKLRQALREAYGDAIKDPSDPASTGWMDIDGLVDQVYDSRSGYQDSLRYFLNSKASAQNAWMVPAEWSARDLENFPDVPPPTKGDAITLGFDGSRSRTRGFADATAIVATRVSDGLQWAIDAWEQPTLGQHWEVPVPEVLAAVEQAFADYSVVGFYADPARWETYVAEWEAKHGSSLSIKASRGHPIEQWMTGDGRKTAAALERYRTSVLNGEMYHTGNPVLTRHVLNARMVNKRTGVQIAKDSPESPRKIDAAIAAVLSWEARLAALAAGADGAPDAPKGAFRRIERRSGRRRRLV